MDTDFCTCHPATGAPLVGRPIRVYDPADAESPYVHTDDDTEALTVHAHIERAATDCDGPHDHTHTAQPDEGESAEDFWTAVVRTLLHTYRPGTLQISQARDGTLTAQWSAQTEEGHERETATRCFDTECAHERSSQRDHFAEAAGY